MLSIVSWLQILVINVVQGSLGMGKAMLVMEGLLFSDFVCLSHNKNAQSVLQIFFFIEAIGTLPFSVQLTGLHSPQHVLSTTGRS